MAKKVKMWKDGDGREIPAEYVPALDKKKDRIAKKYAKQAQKLNQQLYDLKTSLLDECDQLYMEVLEHHDLMPSDRKGNHAIFSFDRKIKLVINVQDRISFTDEINIVQEKLRNYITSKTQGIDEAIISLVNYAFETSKGQLDAKRVLSLMRHNIKDKEWVDAMSLLRECIVREHSKRYARVFVRQEEGNYKAIELNFSSIDI
jgi:hypothetical protein